MPIFEFVCPKCNLKVEKMALAMVHDEIVVEVPTCEKCQGIMEPTISKSSFRLMPGGAGGFYSPSRS